LSLYSILEAVSYVFVAAREQSWVLQEYMLRDSGVCGAIYSFMRTTNKMQSIETTPYTLTWF
jgi:hypothetical protein